MRSINPNRRLFLARALVCLMCFLAPALVPSNMLGVLLILFFAFSSIYIINSAFKDAVLNNVSSIPEAILEVGEYTNMPQIANSNSMTATFTSDVDFSWVAQGNYAPNQLLYPASILLLKRQKKPGRLKVLEYQAKQIVSKMQYASEAFTDTRGKYTLKDLLLFDVLARQDASPIRCIYLISTTLENELYYSVAQPAAEVVEKEVGALKIACQQVAKQRGKGKISDFFGIKSDDLYNSNKVCAQHEAELEGLGEDKDLIYTYMVAASFVRLYVNCKEKAQTPALQTQMQTPTAIPLLLDKRDVLSQPNHYPYAYAIYALFPSDWTVWISLDDQRQIQQDLEKLLAVYGNDITDARLCMVKDLLLVAHLALLAQSPIAGMYSKIKATLNFALEAQVDQGVDTEPLVSNHIFGSAQSTIGHMKADDLYNSKKMHAKSDHTALLQCVDRACDGKKDRWFENTLHVPKYNKLSKNNLLSTETDMIHRVMIKSCLLQIRMDQLSLMHLPVVPSQKAY